MKYDDLVEALRHCAKGSCDDCNYLAPCLKKWQENKNRFGASILMIMDYAAAAIEALQDEVKRLEPKRGKMFEVVRCKDCVYYHKAHVKLDDGTELDYDSDVVKEYQQKRKESGDPFWDMVCADLGMNVGGRCERDNNQGYAEDKAVFRSETDFCSKARAKM